MYIALLHPIPFSRRGFYIILLTIMSFMKHNITLSLPLKIQF